MKLGLLIFLILLAAYGLLAAYAWRFSDEQLFHPEYGSRSKLDGWINIKTPSGGILCAVYLPNSASKYTLWYFHGNAEDLGDLGPRLQAFHQKGYAVFAVEYPGYGLNPGIPTEAGIYDATHAGFQYLTEELGVSPEKIIAYGRSLGGGPAIELAANEPIGGLVLESTFTSAFRVVTKVRILPFDKFDNLSKMPDVRCPILVMHGQDDRVVPFSHGKALYATAPDPKHHLWVKFGGHNDLVDWAGPDYWKSFEAFMRDLD